MVDPCRWGELDGRPDRACDRPVHDTGAQRRPRHRHDWHMDGIFDHWRGVALVRAWDKHLTQLQAGAHRAMYGPMTSRPDAHAALETLLVCARRFGAHSADASLSASESLSVDVRLGALEGVERSESRSIGLRVLIGKQQAAATTSDLSARGLEALAERVAAMAKLAPEDPYCGLLDPAERVRALPRLDLADDGPAPSPMALEDLARACEDAARGVPGVTNSGGAGASYATGASAYMTDDGFFGESRATSFGLGVSAIAEKDGKKERDYDGFSARHRADLPSAEGIGRTAGERAANRLGGRKIDSRKATVIVENRIAARILSPFVGAISGAAVARGVSFLKDKMGQQIFSPAITIAEDPFAPRGLASRPFDGEGAPGAQRALADKGVLTTWLMNAATARQLGLRSTGHATMAHGGPPGIATSNLTALPGPDSLAAMMAAAGEGLLVVEMFSPALNANTGDWSVGVAGFWFERGERAFPVSEITIAGNLLEFYPRVTPGSDLEFRGGFNAPSLKIDGLAIAGV
jgi:PmbA protein